VSADRARELGIVNRVVPDEALETEVETVARHLSEIDPNLLKLTKQAINQTLERQGLLDGLEAALAIDLEIEGRGSPDKLAFMNVARAEGLKAALAWRDRHFPRNRAND
jgi:enoyl-CoA hydratase/carnithine racemase